LGKWAKMVKAIRGKVGRGEGIAEKINLVRR
jgi:hypothetical protein